MRMRNIKNSKEIVAQNPYIINEPEQYQGKMRTLFSDPSLPLHVEIGCGKGDFVIAMALRHPEINFIGIEKFDKVMVRVVKKLEQVDFLPNLKLIRMDAMDIDQVFDHEIDLLYLNFSDPWPKDSHAKRRLTSPVFLKKYEGIFSFKQVIYMKTDNLPLFEYSLEQFLENGYTLQNITYDLHSECKADNVVTEYEEKFSKLGETIKRLEAIK